MTARIILLEGTCGAGKSTLGRALAASSANRGAVSSFTQRDTYAPIVAGEDAGTLDSDTVEVSLLRVLDRIEGGAKDPVALVLVDTLHYTQMVRLRVLTEDAFDRVERRFRALRPTVVRVAVDRATLWNRTIVGRRGTGFARYARKFGATEADIADYFFSEQDRIAALLDGTDHLVVDGTHDPDATARAFLAT